MQLEAAPEDLEIVDGRVTVRGVPDRFVEITELVTLSTRVHGPLQADPGERPVRRASAHRRSSRCTSRASRRTPRPGAFQLTGYAAIQDVGRAINPPEVEGQIHGGAAQSLGRALGEQLVYDSDGQLRTRQPARLRAADASIRCR